MIGALSALGFSVVFAVIGYQIGPWAPPVGAEMADRLAFAMRCDLFASLMLLAGIMNVGNRRFFSPSAIQGSAAPEDPHDGALAVGRAYLQNTLEQFVILLVAHLALASVLSPPSLKILPVLVILFIIGRITFYLGYRRAPTGRAFGFALTFYPNVAVVLFTAARILLG
jgi:hypothetical protein